MTFKRNNVINTGLGLNEKFINDNFMELFRKVSGNINYSDMDIQTKNKVDRQWIPFQIEGNFDKNYALYGRFYIPPNIKSITKASLNAYVSKYRMDSGVADSIPINVSANVDISMGGGGGAIMNTTLQTRPVKKWGTSLVDGGLEAPTKSFDPTQQATGVFNPMTSTDDYLYLSNGDNKDNLALECKDNLNTSNEVVDLRGLQHTHEIPAQAIVLPAHTHTGSCYFTVPAHKHNLVEGIKVSETNPANVKIYINNSLVGAAMSGDGTVQDNIDISSKCAIGGWNTIEVMSSCVSRISIYGTIELLIDNYYEE